MQNLNFVFGDVNGLIPSLSTHPAERAWEWGYPGPTFILQGMNTWCVRDWNVAIIWRSSWSRKYMTSHNTLKYLVINKLNEYGPGHFLKWSVIQDMGQQWRFPLPSLFPGSHHHTAWGYTSTCLHISDLVGSLTHGFVGGYCSGYTLFLRALTRKKLVVTWTDYKIGSLATMLTHQ